MGPRRPLPVFTLAVAVYALLAPALSFPLQGFAPGKSLVAFAAAYGGVALVLAAPLLILLASAWLFRQRYVLLVTALIALELAVMNPVLVRRALGRPGSGQILAALPVLESVLALGLALLFAAVALVRWGLARRKPA